MQLAAIRQQGDHSSGICTTAAQIQKLIVSATGSTREHGFLYLPCETWGMANFGLAVPDTGTDAELLLILRERYAHVAAYGWYRAKDGRIVQDAKLHEIRAEITALEATIAAASATSGPAVNYASRVRAQ